MALSLPNIDDSEALRREVRRLGTFARHPEKVHYVGATGEPAFQNSWVSGGSPAGFYRDRNRVYLTGTVTTGANFTVIFTLPVGYRPAAEHVQIVPDSGGIAQGIVQADGDVLTNEITGDTTTVSYLDGISFRVA